MSYAKCSCSCNFKNCCKSCSYGDVSKMDPLQYDYWWVTWWNNWNTTNGWGPFPSSQSGQNNNTYDNVSGYGITNGVGYKGGYNLPQGKKLMRVYEYNNRFYTRSGDLVFYNNQWMAVSLVPGVKKSFRIISV